MKVFQAIVASLMAASCAAFFVPARTNSFVAQRSPARAAISPLRMADAELEAKVIDVVGEQLGKKGSVTIDSNFIDDLDADSLDTIELIMSLEEEFGVEIAEEEAQKMQCVRDAVAYIEAHK